MQRTPRFRPVRIPHQWRGAADCGSVCFAVARMKAPTRFRLIFTAIIVACGLAATGIACYAKWSGMAPLCFLPYLLGAMLGGPHTPSSLGFVAGLVVQWGITGYALSGLVYIVVEDRRARRSPGKAQEPSDGA